MKYLFAVVIFAILFANFVDFSFGQMNIEQVSGEICSSDWLKIGLDVNETLYISSIFLENDGFIFGSSYDEMYFFNEDNFMRFSEKYLEYFDMDPNFENGSIVIKLMNITNSKDPIKAGLYNISLSAVVQRKDDNYIDVPDIMKTIEIKTPLNIISAEVFDRKNKSNKIVMGDDFSVRFKGIKTDLYFSNITGRAGYHDELFNDFSLSANNDSFQEFYNVTNTMFGNTISSIVCPRENVTIVLDDICTEMYVSFEQVVPNPSDIYFHVDRFFEFMKDTEIPQIYYMVGAYLNCIREDAEIMF